MRDKIATPHFDDSLESKQIVKLASIALLESRSYADQAYELTTWSRLNNSRWPGALAVSLDRKNWHRFVTSAAKYKPKQKSLAMLAWHWLFEMHPKAITPLWRNANGDQSSVPNVLVPALHSFMSQDGKPINTEMLGFLRGDYAVYRPSYMNVENIMLMAMTCGVDNDLSRFEIAMTASSDENAKAEYVEGFAIPYRECILFQGHIKKIGAPFIFIMSGLPLNTDGDGYDRGDGTLLVGASGTLSSAYPITMRRSNGKAAVAALTPEQFEARFPSSEKFIHKEITDFFRRGVVGWR